MFRLVRLNAQFLVFIAGGALSALVDVGLMQLLIANQVNPLAATSAGFLAGLLVNYAFHSKVTFKNVMSTRTLGRFLCVVGLNYCLTLALVTLSLSFFYNALVGKLVSLPLIAANGFFLSKHWIFK